MVMTARINDYPDYSLGFNFVAIDASNEPKITLLDVLNKSGIESVRCEEEQTRNKIAL